MLLTTIITILTIIIFIGFVIFKPLIKIGKIQFESFWLIASLGAILLILLRQVSLYEVRIELFNNNQMNPLKLLTIFITMSGLSVMLEELGFFKKIASLVLTKAGNSQFKIFIYLYLTVSILTVFTSNDIIILTFTPIIIYFTKHAKIKPIPFLIAEFVAANTWSLMLIIGNPTNIYLASTFGVDFIEYFKVMLIPTIITGTFAFGLLYLIFYRDLKKEIVINNLEIVQVKNIFLVSIILIHLILCTILLTIASYLNLEMHLICLIFFISAALIMYCYQKFYLKEKPLYLNNSLKNIPWNLVPFVISMFILVIGLNKSGITLIINNFLINYNPFLIYGFTSFISANLVNNIPMSVLYTNVIANISEQVILKRAIYSSVIGANLGAYLTPIGALAGMMWMRMLKAENVNLSFARFIKYGVLIAIPTLIIALFSLSLFI